MLPLRDMNPARRVPYVTYAIIALNLAMFVYQYIELTPQQNEAFQLKHAVVPYHLLSGYGPALSTPLTSLFMHGGLLHLIANLWYLHVFGDNVEDALGRFRYIAFYLFTGVAGVVAHTLLHPSSHVPMVGASGAISGVLGAYALLYPRARVLTWLAIFFFELPAATFIVLWFAFQVLSGYGALSSVDSGGVAHFAHLGGFLAGIAFVAVHGRPKRGPVTYLGPRIPTRELRRR